MIPALAPFVPMIQLYSLYRLVRAAAEASERVDPPPGVYGFWGSSSSWFTVWNGKAWLNARKLTPDQAQDWHVTQLEAMGGRQPLSAIQLWKWNGSTWQRAA